METTKQVSVLLENKPGRLANILRALEKQKINVTGMTVMDSHEHSVLRLVTSDEVKTVVVLKEMGANYTTTEVLLVELRNQPGALARLCEVLAAEHINIDYCYISAGGRNGKTYGIFKVSSIDKAQRVLAGAGVNSAGKRRLERRPPRDLRSYHTRR
jgi:hypothetical protein